MDALKAYGLSTMTISRIAQLRLPVLRALDWNQVPANDPALIHLSKAVTLLDALDGLAIRVDAAAFYEEQIVIMTKGEEKFYCPAYYLYESGLWTQQEFIDYATSATFYSRTDFAEEFPLVTKVVDASDGYKSIVCQYPVARLDFEASPSLAGLTIK